MFQQAGAGLSEEQKNKITGADQPKADTSVQADLLKKLFQQSMKSAEEAADQRIFESFMNKSKGAISDAVQYKMGKSVL